MRVLFIDIDTLRPDHLGCYGYRRNTSPNIDAIAKEAVRFNSYYCPNAPCLPSRASLVSGKFGFHNGVVGHGGTAADMRLQGEPRGIRDEYSCNNLFNLFRKKGMHTVSISTFAERHSAWWFNASFNECYNMGKGGMESAEEVTPIALDWLECRGKEDNWCMHLHYWDPHTPYRAPSEFGNPFENEELPDNWIDENVFERHLQHTGPHGANEIYMWDDKFDPKYPRHPGRLNNLSDAKNFIDQYDCGIKYVDNHIGQVIDKIKKLGIYNDELCIIVTSDHGENMGELGIYGEHATADEPTCRIPMIIKWNGCLRNAIDNELHTNVDLAPTVEELLNIHKYQHWDGISYAETLKSGKVCGQEFVILTQAAHVCQRSARFGDYLYIRTYHGGYHLFDKEMLFDIKKDPHEQHNIAGENSEICCVGAKYILDWQDKMLETGESITDPLWTVMKEGGPLHSRGFLNSYLERLENTNRSEGAEELRYRYPKEKYL